MILVQTHGYAVMMEDVRLVHDRLKMSVCQQRQPEFYAAINASQSPLCHKISCSNKTDCLTVVCCDPVRYSL